jgi:rhodanese-related sulfurtransferase
LVREEYKKIGVKYAFLRSARERDAEKWQFPMKPNQEFVKQVKKLFKQSDTLLVTCRSGGRVCLAINALASTGFKNIYNSIDGIEGDAVCDPESMFQGQRMKNGWRNSDLPWTYEIVPDRILLPKTN